MKQLISFALLIFFFANISGCAGCSYSFTGASIPPHIKTIAIPMFDDQSGFGDPQLRELITFEVTQKFQSDGNLRIAERHNADSILDGVVTSIREEVAVVAGDGTRAERMRIIVSVRIVWQDLVNREIVFEQSLNNWGEYDVAAGGPAQRRVGLEEAVRKLSEDILLATIARW